METKKLTPPQASLLDKLKALLAEHGVEYFEITHGRWVTFASRKSPQIIDGRSAAITWMAFGRGEGVAFAGLKAAGAIYETTNWGAFGHPRCLAVR
jgi:hypothetical protein